MRPPSLTRLYEGAASKDVAESAAVLADGVEEGRFGPAGVFMVDSNLRVVPQGSMARELRRAIDEWLGKLETNSVGVVRANSYGFAIRGTNLSPGVTATMDERLQGVSKDKLCLVFGEDWAGGKDGESICALVSDNFGKSVARDLRSIASGKKLLSPVFRDEWLNPIIRYFSGERISSPLAATNKFDDKLYVLGKFDLKIHPQAAELLKVLKPAVER